MLRNSHTSRRKKYSQVSSEVGKWFFAHQHGERVTLETGNPGDHPPTEKKKEIEDFAEAEQSSSGKSYAQEHFFDFFDKCKESELVETQDEQGNIK